MSEKEKEVFQRLLREAAAILVDRMYCAPVEDQIWQPQARLHAVHVLALMEEIRQDSELL